MGYLNPLLELPTGKALLELPAEQRAPLEALLHARTPRPNGLGGRARKAVPRDSDMVPSAGCRSQPQQCPSAAATSRSPER